MEDNSLVDACKLPAQHMLKRGVDTLKMEDYQVLYCEEGLATGEELERLKIMSSAEHFVRLLPGHPACTCCCQLHVASQRTVFVHGCLLLCSLFASFTSDMQQNQERISQDRGCAARLCWPRTCMKLSMDVHHCLVFMGGRWRGRVGREFLVNNDLPLRAGALRMDSKAQCAA